MPTTTDNIYTPLEEAKKEIKRRWNDKELQKKVEKYLGKLPDIFEKKPYAILGRHILTSNVECLIFTEEAKKSGLELMGFEYHDDRFLTMNRSKLGLGKMTLVCNKEKIKKDSFDVFNLQENNGKKFSDIRTFWGEKLTDFHHKLLTNKEPNINLVDMSSWIKKWGEKAIDFYPYYMAMFIRNGILFDNYLIKGEESEFTKNVFFPSYEKVLKHFGLKPIIVQLVPKDHEEDLLLCFYEINNIIKE